MPASFSQHPRSNFTLLGKPPHAGVNVTKSRFIYMRYYRKFRPLQTTFAGQGKIAHNDIIFGCWSCFGAQAGAPYPGIRDGGKARIKSLRAGHKKIGARFKTTQADPMAAAPVQVEAVITSQAARTLSGLGIAYGRLTWPSARSPAPLDDPPAAQGHGLRELRGSSSRRACAPASC